MTTHPLAAEYLRDLERSARAMPRGPRQELVAEIRSHLDSAIGPDATEADVRNVLDDLGPPAAIVAATRPPGTEPGVGRRGPREVFALVLLVSGFPFILGWLAGAALLLLSPLWNSRQKLLGLLVWPFGLPIVLGFGVVASGSSGSCGPVGGPVGGPETVCSGGGGMPGWLAVVLVVVLVGAPLLMAAYLYRAAGRASSER